MILEEFSTFTHNIAEQKVQGRVLETLTGVCDGRTVTVSSELYTLPYVTKNKLYQLLGQMSLEVLLIINHHRVLVKLFINLLVLWENQVLIMILFHYKIVCRWSTGITDLRTSPNTVILFICRRNYYVFDIGTTILNLEKFHHGIHTKR